MRCCEESLGATPASAAAAAAGVGVTGDNDEDVGDTSEGPETLKRRVGKYITHLIYIDHATAPQVDRGLLSACGVECVRVYGRKGGDGKMRYDEKALGQALGMILGRRDGRERSRRNTMEVG